MKKKIAIIHDSLNMGGTEKALIYMLDHFDFDRYDVTLWLLNDNGPLQNELNRHVRIAYYSNEPIKVGKLFSQYLRDKEYIRAIKSVVAKIKSRINLSCFYKNMTYDIQSLPYIDNSLYDIVIVYQGLYINLLATAIYRFKALKRIAWIHMRFKHSEEEKILFGSLYKKMDHVFCVSKDIQKHYLSFYSKFNNQCSVLYNILNEEDIRSKASEPCDYKGDVPFLLTVGRLSPEKGQMLIPEIADKLVRDNYSFKWIIIGDGSQYNELKNKIIEKGLENTIYLTGSLNNPYPYYKNCLIYVQPSYSEGYCTSTCEAKLLYKPIIATDVSGMREQITDGVTGYITEIDPLSIYIKIKQLMDTPTLMAYFSENIKKEKRYSMADYYKKIYDVILAEPVKKK